MDVHKLQKLFADSVTVNYGGNEFVLKAPSLSEAMVLLRKWAEGFAAMPEDATDSDLNIHYLNWVAKAIELTLDVENGDIPEGIGTRILLATGGMKSPIGQAACRLCGLPVIEAEQTGVGEVSGNDDLPF